MAVLPNPKSKNEAELLAIFENAPIAMILVDGDRCVKRANQQALSFFHQQESKIIGLQIGEALNCIHAVTDPVNLGACTACQTCVIRNTISHTFKQEKAFYHNETLITIDAGNGIKYLHILVSTSPYSIDGNHLALVYIEDITELKHAEENVRKSEERWSSLIKNAPEFITIINRDNIIEFINHPIPRLTYEDVVGTSVFKFIHERYHNIARECINHVFETGKTCSYISRAPSPDGGLHGMKINWVRS